MCWRGDDERISDSSSAFRSSEDRSTPVDVREASLVANLGNVSEDLFLGCLERHSKIPRCIFFSMVRASVDV